MAYATKEGIEARAVSDLVGSTLEIFCCGLQTLMVAQGYTIYTASPKHLRSPRRIYTIVSFLILGLSFVTMTTSVLRTARFLLRDPDIRTYAFSLQLVTGPWWFVLGQCSWLSIFLVADALLLWRCYLVWQNVWVVIFPTLTYLASMIIGSLCISTQVISIHRPFRLKYGRIFESTFAFLSVSTGVILTSLICFRLVSARRNISRFTEAHDARSYYGGVISTLVESAAPFAIIGLGVASFSLITPTVPLIYAQGVFWNLWFVAGALSPQVIIYRVSVGKSWTRALSSSSERMSLSLRFASNNLNLVSEGKDVVRLDKISGATLESTGV